jgi:hypothetical protein
VRIAALVICLPAILAAQDAREIVRRGVESDRKNVELARNYTYLQRLEVRMLDGSGKVKSTHTQTWDVTFLEGSLYQRLVARNDQPLSAKEEKKEEDKLRKMMEQRRKETKEQRERRIADSERKQERQHEPMKEIPDAFDLRLVGEEALPSGEAYMMDATPKPGYKPKLRSAAYFPKVKGRLWIDKNDYHWAKVEAETLDTISFGGILIRLAKGGHLTLEQARVNQEVWLPKSVTVRASVRFALITGVHAEFIMTFSDYKKFQVDSRVVSTPRQPTNPPWRSRSRNAPDISPCSAFTSPEPVRAKRRIPRATQSGRAASTCRGESPRA